MSWHVALTDEADKELRSLPDDMQARFLHIAAMLEDQGPHAVGMPHVPP